MIESVLLQTTRGDASQQTISENAPMRLAALISDPCAFPVLSAIREIQELELVAVWSATSQLASQVQGEFSSDLLPAQLLVHWDTLLQCELDGVVVAGTSEEVLSAARQLFQRGVRLLVVAESEGGPAKIFEFMPLWQEFPERVSPLFGSGVQVASQLLKRELDSHSDACWRVDFERTLTADSLRPEGLTQQVADQVLLLDLKWLCDLLGHPDHVQMQRSETGGVAVEYVARLGRRGVFEVHWKLRTHPGPTDWRLTLKGQQRDVVARCEENRLSTEFSPAATSTWLNDQRAGGDASEILCLLKADVRVADLVQQLRQWIAGLDQSSNWSEVLRYGEIGAAARRSLLRRRTIDVHFEEASERNQFKSQMAALGCGALLWTMFGMVFLFSFAGLLDPRDREYRQAVAAGFIMSPGDFQVGTQELTEAGKGRLGTITKSWSSTTPVLVVEAQGDPGSELNQLRRSTVLRSLEDVQVRDGAQRTELRPVQGRWFEQMMRVGWVIVFLPLGITLLLQLLIVVTRRS